MTDERKTRGMKCGCFWNGGHWIRLCDKCLIELKKDLSKRFDIIHEQKNDLVEPEKQ